MDVLGLVAWVISGSPPNVNDDWEILAASNRGRVMWSGKRGRDMWRIP